MTTCRRQLGARIVAPALLLAALIATSATAAHAAALEALLGGERRTPVVRAVETAGPAVVNVYTETIVETPFRPRGPFPDGMFPDFYGFRRRAQERQSLGSGVIVDADGTIVTNEHVILQASTIRVLLADKREFTATLVGSDSDFDVAVLKVDADAPLPHVALPHDGDILIGETVIAIGNPYGLSHTVTVGVVSAIGRTIQSGETVYRDFIQTDASINPGNSGGPLLNIEGNLLGINTAIFREAQGIGFAIPANRARNVVEQIVQHGGVQAPWIGVVAQDLTPDLAFHFDVEPASGVLVASVEPDSPAQAAGVSSGQIIERVDGERVRSVIEFTRRTQGVTSGDHVEMAVVENGKRRSISVAVGVLPVERIDEFAWSGLGVAIGANARGPGVTVAKLRPGSPAQEIGILPGDAITALGGRDIDSVEQFRRRLAAVRTASGVLVSVLRGRRLYRVTIPLARS